MHHLTFGINSLLHSVNLIVFTLLLVHLILRISPHHSHQLHSHHLSLPLPFTPDLKLISITNPFLHNLKDDRQRFLQQVSKKQFRTVYHNANTCG